MNPGSGGDSVLDCFADVNDTEAACATGLNNSDDWRPTSALDIGQLYPKNDHNLRRRHCQQLGMTPLASKNDR
jgi:hypothetical protein